MESKEHCAESIAVACAVNQVEVMRTNLAASPMVMQKDVALSILENYPSASIAYNQFLQKTAADIIVFAHQDVYLPRPWETQLREAVSYLQQNKINWAVLGVVGINSSGKVQGQCWSTGLSREIAGPVFGPVSAVSLDEMILVIRKKSGVMFDDNLPGWHLYGADIVQTVRRSNFGAFIIHAPAIHNSLPVLKLDKSYQKSYRYLQQKWKDDLPLQNLVVPITKFAWPIWRNRIQQIFSIEKSRDHFIRLHSPCEKAKDLGYE